MKLTPASELLTRQHEELTGRHLLIINHEDDLFAHTMTDQFEQVSCLALDYQHHQTVQQGSNIHCFFGVDCTSPSDGYSDIIVYFPKAKALASYLLSLAASKLEKDGTLWVVGENNSGIKSIDKLIPSQLSKPIKIDSARRCSIYQLGLLEACPAPSLLQQVEYQEVTVNGLTLQMAILPGVFSHKQLDKGTELLLPTLPTNLTGTMLDFGCGSGIIASVLAKLNPDAQVEAVDISAIALEATRLSFKANNINGSAYPSNGLMACKGPYDAIISNPPFHDGIQTTNQIFTTFIKDSANKLKAGGLWQVVANSHLPYGEPISNHFGPVNILTQNNKFKVYKQIR